MKLAPVPPSPPCPVRLAVALRPQSARLCPPRPLRPFPLHPPSFSSNLHPLASDYYTSSRLGLFVLTGHGGSKFVFLFLSCQLINDKSCWHRSFLFDPRSLWLTLFPSASACACTDDYTMHPSSNVRTYRHRRTITHARTNAHAHEHSLTRTNTHASHTHAQTRGWVGIRSVFGASPPSCASRANGKLATVLPSPPCPALSSKGPPG